MKDRFETRGASTEGSIVDGFEATPGDPTDLAELSRAIYVDDAGRFV